jgi:hypothetical protein
MMTRRPPTPRAFVAGRPHARAAALAAILGLVAAGALGAPAAPAQVPRQVPGGDFDICDNTGTLRGNRAFLTGRSGQSTNQGYFVIVNAATEDQDCDLDGYTPGVDFLNLFRDTTLAPNFVNVQDPTRVILGANFRFLEGLQVLNNGAVNRVHFIVDIPNGTPAGRYEGRVTINDAVLNNRVPPPGGSTDPLRSDAFDVEIEVLPTRGIDLVQGDTAAALDSLVLRGRPGQTVSGVVRVANLGNIELANARLDATDLIATSGTGLVIPRSAISFSEPLANVAIGDTARLTVTVRIPRGILAGRYAGDLIVQAENVTAVRIPLTVIVTTAGDIVFETNPITGRNADNAVIIFNADPGSEYRIRIFDMMGLAVFGAAGTVFAGQQSGGVQFEADQAVRFSWPLVNGRGEQIAGGMYLVVVDAQQDGRRRQMRDKLMVIR